MRVRKQCCDAINQVRWADLRSSLLNVRQAPWSLMFYNVCQGLPMFANVNQCFQRFTTAHRHSLMFTNVRQCFPLFSNVHQGSHWSSHWQVLPRCLNVFFLLLCVFLHPVSHFIVPLLWAQQVLRERGHFSIWVQENLSSDQMVPPPQIPPHIHCRLKEKYGYCWKNIFRANITEKCAK